MGEEIWMPVIEYEDAYEVSNMGRVNSLPRIVDYHCKQAKRKGKFLALCKDQDGYLLCALCKNSKCTTTKVHRLVAQHFIPNPLNLPEVNHKNGIKWDNRVDNLEWCTSSENQKHKFRYLGVRMRQGEEWVNAKITNKQAWAIYNDPRKQRDIAKEYNICYKYVNNIKRGRAWKGVIEKFKQNQDILRSAPTVLSKEPN